MFDINTLTTFFGWCSVINIIILIFSSLSLVLFKGFIIKVHSNLLSINQEDLPKLYFKYLSNYKIGVVIFNVVPYFALKLMA